MTDIKIFGKDYLERLKSLLDMVDLASVDRISQVLWQAYKDNRQVFVLGNGGSASTAAHIACDLAKTIRGHKGDHKWKAFRIVCLNDNIALITAWSNDVGYESVYSEQLQNLAEKNDVLIAISSSGNSKNILEAVRVGKNIDMQVIAIAGFGGGKLAELADVAFVTDWNEYGPVEDIQLILNHLLTAFFYQRLLSHG